MKKTTALIAILAASSLAIQSAQAIVTGGGVTTGSGSFIKLSVPLVGSNPANTVGNNNFQNTNLYAFDEDQNVAVAAGGLNPNIGPALAAGTIVASHYVFFDPNQSATQVGFVTFDADILGVFTSTGTLAASDYLANTGVNYLNPGLRGLEAGDTVSINAGDAKRLDVRWTASTPGDYVRVLTKRSPGADRVPDSGMTLMLLGIGLSALAVIRRYAK